jgi:uncharacterized protein YndB with AHSA1/START domain
MAKTVRSRRIGAPPDAVWRVVGDPHQLPRWWPGVTRVERVDRERFTLVMPTKRGKPVRLDQRVSESVELERRGWTQELPGTPFERLLEAWTTTIELQADGDGTIVRLVELQQLRGSFRPGALLQRRPARKRVEGALTALAELF